jgi:hypothetical protein
VSGLKALAEMRLEGSDLGLSGSKQDSAPLSMHAGDPNSGELLEKANEAYDLAGGPTADKVRPSTPHPLLQPPHPFLYLPASLLTARTCFKGLPEP